MADSPFEMKVDLAVLQSLGINLYSNAAAVLSEIVANAWDADANTIKIDWRTAEGQILIEDDGIGMSAEDLNHKYLKVGYQKRDQNNDGLRSALGRPYMGRKGIGKLSVFSLANDVTVATRADGSPAQALRITRAGLEEAIRAGVPYHPETVDAPGDLPERGTRILLQDLNSKRAAVTIRALRRRIARRFDVIHESTSDSHGFRIVINDEPVGFADREDLARVEYFWSLGPSTIPAAKTPKVRQKWELDGVVDEGRGWKLSGWFGTVPTPADLQDKDDEQESLRNIIIIARKRPIQEGILDQLHFNKLFGNYVTGQITAEFLDLDDTDQPDIATSDRQRLIEDDERVGLLRDTLRARFLEAERQWSEQRPRDKFRDLLAKYPSVHEWVDERPTIHRAAARRIIQTIAALTLENENSRRELFRAGILAFERLALDATTDQLNKFADSVGADEVLPVLASQRALEDALYGQILRSRIAAIDQLESLVDDNERERALQEHLFKNMWLLDPSWEHPTANPTMETSLKRIRGDVFDPSEEDNREQGRIDIKYRRASGTHIIVELKRYRRKCTLDELYDQGEKYWSALVEVLEKTGERKTDGSDVEVIFVLGAPIDAGRTGKKTAEEAIADRLSAINGRVFYYDAMLKDAHRQYVEYGAELEKKNNSLARVLATLGDGAPESNEGQVPDEASRSAGVPEESEAEAPEVLRASTEGLRSRG